VKKAELQARREVGRWGGDDEVVKLRLALTQFKALNWIVLNNI
jgi:hypothetical protein